MHDCVQEPGGTMAHNHLEQVLRGDKSLLRTAQPPGPTLAVTGEHFTLTPGSGGFAPNVLHIHCSFADETSTQRPLSGV